MPRSKIKNKVLAKMYIKNDMNATKTIRQLKPHLTKNSAEVRGYEMLHNEGFQKSVIEELELAGLTEAKVAEIHRRNLIQEENLPASNSAIDMYHKVKGSYAPQRTEKITLNLTGKELQEHKRNLLEELKEVSNA